MQLFPTWYVLVKIKNRKHWRSNRRHDELGELHFKARTGTKCTTEQHKTKISVHSGVSTEEDKQAKIWVPHRMSWSLKDLFCRAASAKNKWQNCTILTICTFREAMHSDHTHSSCKNLALLCMKRLNHAKIVSWVFPLCYSAQSLLLLLLSDQHSSTKAESLAMVTAVQRSTQLAVCYLSQEKRKKDLLFWLDWHCMICPASGLIRHTHRWCRKFAERILNLPAYRSTWTGFACRSWSGFNPPSPSNQPGP